MKFGKQLQKQSVKAWQEYYMSYKRLKRIIKKLMVQMKERDAEGEETNENTKLLNSSHPIKTDISPTTTVPLIPANRTAASHLGAHKEFFAVLENDIDTVNRFFVERVAEYEKKYNDLAEIDSNHTHAPLHGHGYGHGVHHSTSEETLERAASLPLTASHLVTVESADDTKSASHTPLRRSRSLSAHAKLAGATKHTVGPLRDTKNEERATRCLELYRECLQLQSYRELNYLGISKIIKKFDKNVGESHRDVYIRRLNLEPFMSGAVQLDALTNAVEELYTKLAIARNVDINQALGMLKAVKRDVEQPQQEEEDEVHIKPYWILISILLAITVYFIPILSTEPRAHHAASLLAFVTVLWVTEAVPFFVTGLCIPLFVIIAGILADPVTGSTLNAEKASKAAFGAMFNDTIMLILGGFSISAAFSKCQFELRLASIIQRSFGERPRIFLLAFMLLGAFLSMWISNVAAPLLLTSLLLPIVRDFPRTSPYARALLLGLAFSCNIGGMMSPISSPQNAVALGYLESSEPKHAISFMSWLSVSIPFCLLSVILSWLYIVLVMLRESDTIPPSIPTIVYEKSSLTRIHYIVLCTSLLTIALWCSLSYTKPIFGEMGTVAVIPFVVFFASGILSKNDLHGFSWNLLLLIGSGSVLGAAVNSSRLLHLITDELAPLLLGRGEWVTTVGVLLLVYVISTFVSHTVSSLILTPLIVSVGVQVGHVQLLVMTATLMMSGTMSLPMSSFPNVNSLLVDDDFGRPYLHAMDFLRHGTPVSIGLLLLLCTLGYGMVALMVPGGS